MGANEVRQAILKTIEGILREHSESHSVTDEAIAEALCLELQLTRDHLDFMQQDDYVYVIKTFGGWSASLTAKGRLALKDTILHRELAEARENLRLIRERKSQYVQATDIPLQLTKEEQHWLKRLEELERRVETLERTHQQQTPRREVLSQTYLTQLLQVLDERFSEGELQTLCFYLDIDYDSLSGEGKSGKARELVKYLRRRNRIDDLVETGTGLRPDIPWPEVVNDG